jgi:50S ribosomal protein uL3
VIEGLLGRKIGMTQIFDETGAVIPVTVLEVGPCVVTQIRVRERDGYEAVQIGFGDIKPKSLNKPQRGHLAGAGKLVRYLREFAADNPSEHKVGEVLTADLFEVGQMIDVTGTSKGRGFQGAWFNWCWYRPGACVQEHAHGGAYGWPAGNSDESLGRRSNQRPQPSARTGIRARCQEWPGHGAPCSEGPIGVV